MKIQLLIAGDDRDYIEHLSNVLVEKYADVFEVSICFEEKPLIDLLSHRRFDVALLSTALVKKADLSRIRLPLFLWDDTASGWTEGMQSLRKYQRISSIVSDVLEHYAEVTSAGLTPGHTRGRIVVAWSPAGGVGKTTAALAYAAQKVSEQKRTVYLNLEPFSSTPAFFPEGGKSISSIFDKLDERAELILQSIRQEDNGSGVCYFCRPDNYEDISLLSGEDVIRLAEAASADMDEVIVDLGAGYDPKATALLELADMVLLVVDGSRTCGAKFEQFQSQHELCGRIQNKSVLIVNQGGTYDSSRWASLVTLPQVRSKDPIVVYKTLSAGYFTL